MDLTLYFKIYEEGVDKLAILKFTEYTETRHFLNIVKDHV